MKEVERQEIIASLNSQAERARTLAALYEEAAETVARFPSDEEYAAMEMAR